MTGEAGQRIQVVLRWIQILDKMEPFYKEGDATAGSVESSVAIPMPKREEGN